MLDRVLNTALLEVPKFAKFDWLDALGQYKIISVHFAWFEKPYFWAKLSK